MKTFLNVLLSELKRWKVSETVDKYWRERVKEVLSSIETNIFYNYIRAHNRNTLVHFFCFFGPSIKSSLTNNSLVNLRRSLLYVGCIIFSDIKNRFPNTYGRIIFLVVCWICICTRTSKGLFHFNISIILKYFDTQSIYNCQFYAYKCYIFYFKLWKEPNLPYRKKLT